MSLVTPILYVGTGQHVQMQPTFCKVEKTLKGGAKSHLTFSKVVIETGLSFGCVVRLNLTLPFHRDVCV